MKAFFSLSRCHLIFFSCKAFLGLFILLPLVSCQITLLPGYIPDSAPADNPNTLSDPVPMIPSAPDCTVRPETIVEIRKMRLSAAYLAQMIQTEVTMMEKRKSHIEKMTVFINDRIKELNLVKADLASEIKWIKTSQARIAELSAKEKLAKMQDVLSCLEAEKQAEVGSSQAHQNQIEALSESTSVLEKSVADILSSIEKLNSRTTAGTNTTPDNTNTTPDNTASTSTTPDNTANTSPDKSENTDANTENIEPESTLE